MQILCLLCFIATLGSAYQFVQVIKRIDASKTSQDATNVVFVDLLNAETGQRGYIITGNEDYLSPYNIAVTQVKLDVANLVKATARDPDDVAIVVEMTALIEDEMKDMAGTIDVRKTQGLAGAAAKVDQDHGKNIMDHIRVKIDTITLHETTKFIRDEADGITYGRIAFIAMMLTLLFGSFLAFRQPK